MVTLTEKPGDSMQSDAELAGIAGQQLSRFLIGSECVDLELVRESGEKLRLSLPADSVRQLAEILELVGRGLPVRLIPQISELSTIQAAEVLRVSRPHFVKLLEEGKIPFRYVGAHRRVQYDDLLKYQNDEREAAKSCAFRDDARKGIDGTV